MELLSQYPSVQVLASAGNCTDFGLDQRLVYFSNAPRKVSSYAEQVGRRRQKRLPHVMHRGKNTIERQSWESSESLVVRIVTLASFQRIERSCLEIEESSPTFRSRLPNCSIFVSVYRRKYKDSPTMPH